MDIRKILKSGVVTHMSAALVGYLMALSLIGIGKDVKFNKRQDAAVYTTDARGRSAQLNRDIFDSGTFELIAWRHNTNQRVGEVLGKTAAQEFAMDIDSLKSGSATASQMYGDERDYCGEAIVRAYNDAVSRQRFRRANIRAVPFPADRCDSSDVFKRAMKNAKHLVKYFERDSVPNSIIVNPEKTDMGKISAGSIIRHGRHAYMYMGIGYIDKHGQTFVADSRGLPVIASSDGKKLFEYFDWSRCTVVDVPKIVEYKLQHDVQRHVR